MIINFMAEKLIISFEEYTQIVEKLAIQIYQNYKKKYLPPNKFISLLKKNFSPYCSVATWYLWRSIDPEPIQY